MTNTAKSNEQEIQKDDTAVKNPSGGIKVLALLLAILFVIVAVIGVIGFDVWRVVFNPTLVKQNLTDEILHSELVPVVLEYFSEQRAEERVEKGEALSGVDEPDIVLLMSFLQASDWKEIKQLMTTDEFLTHLVSVSVDELYKWIDSNDQWPQIVWDMTAFKSRVQGQEGEEAIMIAYEALPECTEEEIADFEQRMSEMPPGVEVLYNLCQFPEPYTEDQIGDYLNALIDVNQNVPDQFDFSQMLSESEGASTANPATLKSQLRLLRTVAHWSWLGALVLLVLIAALAVRSLKSLGKWVGIPLTISSAIVLVTALAARAKLASLFTTTMLSHFSAALRQEVENSLVNLTNEIFQPMMIQGIILLVVGIVLIVLMVVKRGSKKENTTA